MLATFSFILTKLAQYLHYYVILSTKKIKTSKVKDLREQKEIKKTYGDFGKSVKRD